MTQAFSGRTLRARFKSVRALRFLLHTLRLRYFCSGKIHKFCCKIASMQVELTLFVTPSLKVSWLPSEAYVLSGDLSRRALTAAPDIPPRSPPHLCEVQQRSSAAIDQETLSNRTMISEENPPLNVTSYLFKIVSF